MTPGPSAGAPRVAAPPPRRRVAPTAPDPAVRADPGTRRPARGARPTAAPAARAPRPTPRAGVPQPRQAPASGRRRQPVVVVGRPAVPPARPGTSRRRQGVVLGVVLVLLAVFSARLVQVQGLQGPEIAETARDRRMVTVPIPGDRGQVLDTDGEVLATSVERYDVVVNQLLFTAAYPSAEEVADQARELATVLGLDPAALGPQLVGDRGYVYLAKGVLPEVQRQVAALRVAGITSERTTQRLYPEGSTAGPVVGFVGAEGYGQAGIEQMYDDLLAGRPGEETYERGALGQRIPAGEDDLVPAVPGHDVRLTLDRDLQWTAQGALDRQVTASGAEWGVVEVVDVRTGAILVLADSGSFDPNDPTDASPSRAVATVYEPGSTAKVIAMAAILEQGLATPASEYVVPYTYTTSNGQTFKDSHEHGDLPLTLAGILAESSNTGTVMVGQGLPPQVRHDYLRAFGLGETTGVGLPGESAGLLAADPDDWDGRTQYTVLFGQGVAATTLQTTQVFATIANGGVRVQPHVVEATIAPDGTEQPVDLADPVQVVSPETATTLLRMLETAVAEGTGGLAAVPGYRIAGKTGTAQAFLEGGQQKTVASFIGIAPADDPRFVVNVALYDPKSSIYGGEVAAPVFREVAAEALRAFGVPPSGTAPELLPTTWE